MTTAYWSSALMGSLFRSGNWKLVAITVVSGVLLMDGSGNNASTENLNLLFQWAMTCGVLIQDDAF
jgi:hypothetical protein